MRFTCEKNMLVTGLNIAGRTVAQKSSLSVIEGILCKAGQGLSLTGYNMETAITYEIDADVSDMGQCILPAKLFGDIIRRLPEGPVTVVVDPGHGGEDGGAVAADGTVESGINLAIAQDLDALLRFLGCETRMTRTEDAAIYSDGARTLREKKASDLKNRAALVNETPNAVLLSIHQNSLPASRRVHGAQAFHARTEGSEALAESVQVALNAAVNLGNEKSRKVIDKSVYLMKNISCPAVLVECGFLSNAEEAARLCETDYQRKLAVTVAAGFLAGLAGGQAAA